MDGWMDGWIPTCTCIQLAIAKIEFFIPFGAAKLRT